MRPCSIHSVFSHGQYFETNQLLKLHLQSCKYLMKTWWAELAAADEHSSCFTVAGPCGNVKKSPANSGISTGCCLSAGTAAIQVAKQIGAKIFTTAGSQEKLDFAKELGAHVLINYKEQDFAEVVKKETAGPELKVSMHHVQPAEGSDCCGRLHGMTAFFASVLFCWTLIGAMPSKHVRITL